ncbi:EscU/YscU/HrcU family type III secretion system export apparatus switch protein [Caulobacter sp. S45]|uniref:EscU/YscU/HrcU family type III secretion system export apparatus switch protein n=1 Tax=Caulobacter sp. S45 TaxID=1641861 RepID=UPI00131CAD48|nr:EscU/YscU/HrcU family type III secretion system export apparatus switch protein [Caulobacter sp. S45]
MSETSKGPLAVALFYEKPHAPRVVAKGRGDVGQAIVDTARQHGVPLEQNPALAEALSAIELDREIPKELYQAVAIVIGFVLRASGQIGPAKRPRSAAKR